MIKRLIQHFIRTRQERKELGEKLNPKYPTVYLYYGESVKKIEEDGVSFEYDHSDCFLADSEVDINSFVRLTGEGAKDCRLNIYAVSKGTVRGNVHKRYYTCDHYGTYMIDTLDRFGTAGYMRLDEIVNQLDWINKRAKDRAKTEAIFDNK